ncbi:rod-binding protein [Planktotalea frisia]|jgi:flagellar protein FlgJ|uniref:rod-binding protein n=1 Tax=Planktotalea frisia TaxID=696762 RepID=UPI002353B8AC|nr:rod-binding protein [Planktotalea frisia]
MTTISATALKMAVAPGVRADPLHSTGPSDRDKLEEVAGQFEALFVKSILSSARSAQLADPLLNSEATKTFNSMLDQEYATALSKRETLGIADALVGQFQHRVSDGDV